MVCNNLTLRGNLDLNWCLYSGLAFVGVLMHMFDPLYEFQVILSGVNPTTNDRMILYYCLKTKVDWF
jgi:hypothetical protein